jgi:predicted DNA repair protein MutK
MPKVMNALGFIGMVAMLMVGGGILMHNLPFLHSLEHLGLELFSSITQIATLFIVPVLIALFTGVFMLLLKKLLGGK